MGWAPALYGIAGILSAAGKQRKDNKDYDGIDVIKPINPIVVVVTAEFVPRRPSANNRPDTAINKEYICLISEIPLDCHSCYICRMMP